MHVCKPVRTVRPKPVNLQLGKPLHLFVGCSGVEAKAHSMQKLRMPCSRRPSCRQISSRSLDHSADVRKAQSYKMQNKASASPLQMKLLSQTSQTSSITRPHQTAKPNMPHLCWRGWIQPNVSCQPHVTQAPFTLTSLDLQLANDD